MAVDDLDALKALVDDALARGTHPDVSAKLTEWREEHTTEEEKEASLTDDERAEKAAKREQEEKTKAESRSGAPRKA